MLCVCVCAGFGGLLGGVCHVSQVWRCSVFLRGFVSLHVTMRAAGFPSYLLRFPCADNHLPKIFLPTRLPFLSKYIYVSLVSVGVLGVTNSAGRRRLTAIDSLTSCPILENYLGPWTSASYQPLDAEELD